MSKRKAKLKIMGSFKSTLYGESTLEHPTSDKDCRCCGCQLIFAAEAYFTAYPDITQVTFQRVAFATPAASSPSKRVSTKR